MFRIKIKARFNYLNKTFESRFNFNAKIKNFENKKSW